jgi:TATA-binding protein-associated factor
VKSLRIDGSTPALDRARLADTFNADASIHAFLLSTRAAGTGLNLVGADTVIFYDHDWNPANDAQAMDRAYRIGQTRNVTVYKLVSRGTLEEKILARQSEKLMLAEGVIGADPGGFKDLSREELLDLFTLDGEA